jgi:hypothetical protein
MRVIFAGLVALSAMASTSGLSAQKPLTAGAEATVTATIQSIDSTNRLIMLKFDDGDVETLVAGPEVKRFDELKLGDRVTFRYRESVVVQVRKPGTATGTGAVLSEAVTRGAGARPSATMAQQIKALVTVTAVDMAVPSITVRTEDGSSVSYKVEDKKNLEGVAVGDRIEIAFTRALMVSVADAK